jgi:hypothetical protein
VRRAELKVGSVYFGVSYEDDAFTRPILHSYEYLGEKSGRSEALLLFRFLGSEDELQLSERQLDLILDAQGLIELLARLRDGKPLQTPRAS